MSKKKVIISIAAGVAVVGGIVALIVRHNKKKNMESYDLDFEDEYDEEFWEDDLDDEEEISPELAERVVQYHEAAERLLRELEEGNYGV